MVIIIMKGTFRFQLLRLGFNRSTMTLKKSQVGVVITAFS